jgi:hypothetical protein
MLQQRQLNDIYQLLEISFTAASTPGAITNGSVVSSTPLACTLQGTTNPATFALGDNLEVIAPASAALNGVQVAAYPLATAGSCNLVFTNNTGGTVTPTAATVYKIIAKRFTATVI